MVRKTIEASTSASSFASLPHDIIHRILAPLSIRHVCCASQTCRSWHRASETLREAMLFMTWGKKYKHGNKGVAKNIDKALDCFLKGAARGSAPAMVDAGLLLWEQGKNEAAMRLYRQAADQGNPQGQANLGLALLEDTESPEESAREAVAWLEKAAGQGNVRALYSLGLCLQRGRGVAKNMASAVECYRRGAIGGNARAMHNLALCHEMGEGVPRNGRTARFWMQRAADAGHAGAQCELAQRLVQEGHAVQAMMYLEVAVRRGNERALILRDSLVPRLDGRTYPRAVAMANSWQPKAAGGMRRRASKG